MLARERRSTIWVRGGRPIRLPDRPVAEGPAEPDPAEPGSTGQDQGGGQSGAGDGVSSGQPQSPQQPPLDDPARRVLDLMDLGYWAERMADVLDQAPTRRVRDKAIIFRGLAAAFDVTEVADAIGRQDMVGAHVATLEMLGGPFGVMAMELTGFDEKLRTLQGAGYSVSGVMDYSVEVAGAIVSPFSFGRPAPYSQMIVGDGVPEQALEAEIRNYEQGLREAAEERRRQR